MKKLITMMIVAIAASAQAAAFNWGTTVPVNYDGSNVTDGTATGYLVYLGQNADSTAWGFDGTQTGADAVLDSNVDTGMSTSTGFPSTMGKIGEAFDKSYGSSLGSGNFTTGATFGMVITYEVGGVMYYNISNDLYTFSGADDITTNSPANYNFNWADNDGKLDSTAVGAGWTPVPEPATAALAIAGLAMLIKRRK